MSSENKIKKPRPEKELLDRIKLPRVKIIGLGGGGCSIVAEVARIFNKHKDSFRKRVEFVAANVDLRALSALPRKIKKIQFGQQMTYGLGCGMDPELGRKSAEQALEQIKKNLCGADLCVFITCLGGGTGSGAMPIFAKAAESLNVLSLGIFTLPFKFEGAKKQEISRGAIENARQSLSATITIPNQKIFQIVDEKTPLKEALFSLNKALGEMLRDLMETIYNPGIINLDFADFKTIFQDKGELAFLSSGEATGKDRAIRALENLIKNPLFEYKLNDAKNFIFNISGGEDLTMKEIGEISNAIYQCSPKAKIIFGIARDRKMKNKIKIILLAIGSPKKTTKTMIAKKKIEKTDLKENLEKKTPADRGKKTKKIIKIKNDKESPQRGKEANIKSEIGEFSKPRTRRNGLDVHKIMKESEEALLKEEEKWDAPAFLRKKTY